MSPTIDIEGKMDGGILSGLARKCLSGKSMFFQELVARRGVGKVIFGHTFPGGIMDVELDGSYGLTLQKNGFLASTQGINIETKTQRKERRFLMAMTLGAPSYSFQYTNFYENTFGANFSATRTISGLNLKTEENDDGITPDEWFTFIDNVLHGLGVSWVDPDKLVYPKYIENRIYEPE